MCYNVKGGILMEAIQEIIAILKERYPEALCALQYRRDYELMISVRL